MSSIWIIILCVCNKNHNRYIKLRATLADIKKIIHDLYFLIYSSFSIQGHIMFPKTLASIENKCWKPVAMSCGCFMSLFQSWRNSFSHKRLEWLWGFLHLSVWKVNTYVTTFYGRELCSQVNFPHFQVSKSIFQRFNLDGLESALDHSLSHEKTKRFMYW